MSDRTNVRIHPTAEVSSSAVIGPGTSVWNHAQVREGARIGSECIIGKNVYVDVDVVIGDRCKVQNNVSLYHGVTVEDGVFIGPHVCFTNDREPRAINRDGSSKTDADWEVTPIARPSRRALWAPTAPSCRASPIGRWAMVGVRQRRHPRRGRSRAGRSATRRAAGGAPAPAATPLNDARRRHAVRRCLPALRQRVPARGAAA